MNFLRSHIRSLEVALGILATLYAWSLGWGLPALEDDKFWWIPTSLLASHGGSSLFFVGDLPLELVPPGLSPPAQWSGPLPDYGHPPLFFLYLGLFFRIFPKDMATVRLALLPLALMTTLGTLQLQRRLSKDSSRILTALLVPLTPAIAAQLSRADLDLGLLALAPFALEALIIRRFVRFGVLAALATWCKEPGVLLAVSGLACAFTVPSRLRFRALLGASMPLFALAAWGALHKWRFGWALAEAERLPQSLIELLLSLKEVSQFVLLEQGRGVFLLALFYLLWRSRPRSSGASRSLPSRSREPMPQRTEPAPGREEDASSESGILLGPASYVLAHVLFFGVVNFLGGDPMRVAGSHWRYLVPCLPPLIALGTVWLSRLRLPLKLSAQALALILALLDWHGPPRGGVERNLYALDLAVLHREVRPTLERYLAKGATVYVGSYAWPDFVSEVVGLPDPPLRQLLHYGPQTDARALPPGTLVMESSHGEPLGTLSSTLQLFPLERLERHRAFVQLYRVEGLRQE